METAERAGRPWAFGIGFLLLGLGVSAMATTLGLQPESGPVARALGTAGYAGGILVAGVGIHRLLWAGPSRRSVAARVLLTAIVTLPAFVLGAVVLSVLITMVNARFAP